MPLAMLEVLVALPLPLDDLVILDHLQKVVSLLALFP